MTTYQKFIKDLSDNNVDRVFLNSDEEKARDVSVQIFSQSNSILRVFAGCLCSSFCNEGVYVQAISDFIERGGLVRILLNDYKANLVSQSPLFRRLAYYMSDNRDIQIRETDVKPYLASDPEKKNIHFMVGDNKAYRVEEDIENKSAFCNFNNERYASMLINYFDAKFETAADIDILNLFNYGNM